jgi:hypothetical protein
MSVGTFPLSFIVVYYESIWVGRGTGTPKDKDEVNKREVCECEG